MKIFWLILSISFSSICIYAQPKSYDYAYVNKKGICVYSVEDKLEHLVATRGDNPSLSPDGTKLAYTGYRKDGSRYILLVNLATKKKTILNINNSNCYGPVWSPNGKMIAYNALGGNIWFVNVIDANNSGPRFLKISSEDVFSPTWLANGVDLAVQNRKKIQILDLAGNISRTFDLKALEGGLPELKEMVGNSSLDKFIFAANNKVAFCSETEGIDGDEPPEAVFVYDMSRKKTLRLSPKSYSAFEIALSGNKIFFSISKFNSSTQNIAEVDLEGKNFKILFPGCSEVSVRN